MVTEVLGQLEKDKMEIKKRLRNLSAAIAMSLGSVEKNALNNNGGKLDETNAVQGVNQNTLMNDLINGQLTEQVKQFRDRYYRIISESDKIKVGRDGSLNKIDPKQQVKNIITENETGYELDLVVENRNYGGENAIMLQSTSQERVNVEPFIDKLHIKKGNINFLIEMFVPKYVNRNISFNKSVVDMVESSIKGRETTFNRINEIGFISNYNVIGSDNLMEYNFKLNGLVKITEDNQFYILKYIATPNKYNHSLYDEFLLND